MSRAARASLDFVKDEECPVIVAEVAQTLPKTLRRLIEPPSPWIGSTRIAAVCGPTNALAPSRVAVGRADDAGTIGPNLLVRWPDPWRGGLSVGAGGGGFVKVSISFFPGRALVVVLAGKLDRRLHRLVPELQKDLVEGRSLR